MHRNKYDELNIMTVKLLFCYKYVTKLHKKSHMKQQSFFPV